MANNVNLGTARGNYAAILHSLNNFYRYTNVGAASALNDPSSKEIQDATNPMMIQNTSGTTISYAPGTSNPRITLTWTPAYAGGYRTQRDGAGGAADSNGVKAIQAAQSLVFNFNKTIEFEIIQSLATADFYMEPLTLEYLAKLEDPRLRMGALVDDKYTGTRAQLVRIGNEILRRLDRDMLIPMDDDLITTLATGVGRNVAYPWDNTNGTLNAPITQVYAFKADGTPDVDFWNYIQNSSRDNRYEGKAIFVGGSKMAQYMQLKGIVGLADTGYLLDSQINNLPVHWYYDARIDTILGQDEFLMWDSGAAALQTWLNHSEYGSIKQKRYANMDYGNMRINLAQYRGIGLDGNLNKDNITLDLDVRMLEGRDSSDYPTSRVVPTVNYGVFMRPVGYFTSDNTDPLYYMTGIFRGKLLTRS